MLSASLARSSGARARACSSMLFSKGEIPDLNKALLDAIIGALDAHQLMSTQALNSEEVREGILDILLNHTHLYEDLRDRGLKR